MKIVPARSGAGAFLSLFRTALKSATIEEKSDPKRLVNLRCSQLPYCPRSVLYKWASSGLMFEMDMMMHYYVNVGHSVHNTMQSYLALSGKFVADYKCRVCKKWHRFSTKSRCCGKPCEYHEVLIDYKGIVGHIDAILKVEDRYYIVDFKTTSLSGSKTKQKKPGNGYVRQVLAYAYLLKKQYKIEVAGSMLVFLPRDNPKNAVVWEQAITPKVTEDTRKALKHDRQLHKRTMEAKTLAEFKELLKERCGGEYCDGCKAPTAGLLNLLKEQRDEFPISKTFRRDNA